MDPFRSHSDHLAFDDMAFEPSHQLRMSQDAALVIGLAATAMPFAHTAEDQTESWLRTLCLHGNAGTALQELGMRQEPLISRSTSQADAAKHPTPADDVVDRVVRSATEFAIARGAEFVGTADVLFALFDTYGRTMDRALYLHGITRQQVFDHLAGAGRPLNSLNG